jgi:membrane protease YdiL (CAAX protease family)
MSARDWIMSSPALSTQARGPAVAAAAILCLGVFVGVANDLVFALLRGSYGIYLVDYATKAALVAIAWPVAVWLAPATARRCARLIAIALFAACIVVGVGSQALVPFLEAWRLFEWPHIPWPALHVFDLTAGLLLNAVAEELIYRRIALAALPFSAHGNLAASALLFGLIHWGGGPGAIFAAALTALALGYAYQRTGSLTLVIVAHYLVNLVLFW